MDKELTFSAGLEPAAFGSGGLSTDPGAACRKERFCRQLWHQTGSPRAFQRFQIVGYSPRFIEDSRTFLGQRRTELPATRRTFPETWPKSAGNTTANTLHVRSGFRPVAAV